MKILTIGRDESCNIVLSDSTVSRRHAILKIHATGKMEIISMGQNGTFVNGVILIDYNLHIFFRFTRIIGYDL
jgi:pSer/pThr/pTyr-binding forkhead associated (FHA) protein